MANTQLFASLILKKLANAEKAVANTLNQAGAAAYALSPQAALAQYALTGCLHNTYYASAEVQLTQVLALAVHVDDRFLAQLAIYARQQGLMKDMPALLLAVLAQRRSAFLPVAFAGVVDNGRLLRNFVQILRSGVVGRKSLGTRPKKLVQHWLNQATPGQLLAASVGNAPSLADVVRMVHPNPAEPWRAAFFGWLLARPFALDDLPDNVRRLERFRRGLDSDLPDVPFLLLTALPLDTAAWTQLALRMTWQQLRMNLNTLQRQGVFANAEVTQQLALRLTDAEAIRKAKVFPYQLLMAWKAARNLPPVITEALQVAMELALCNVPVLPGRVVVCPDVSGSMASPVSGGQGTATSAVRCIDVAALITAALLRRNPQAQVLPFAIDVEKIRLQADAPVMVNAQRLAAIGGGGTNCAAPLVRLNREQARVDLVVLVSDNESWVNNRGVGKATALMAEWQQLQRRNPQARLVCIDLQPNAHTQAVERPDILNIGGFGDEVFQLLARFACGEMQAGHWEAVIGTVNVDLAQAG